jgi:hypothetical protein
MTSSTRTKRVLIGIVVVPLVTAVGLEIGCRLIDRARGKPFDADSSRAAVEDVCRKLSRAEAVPVGPPDEHGVQREEPPSADPVVLQPYTGWEHPRTQEAITADARYYKSQYAERVYDIVLLGGSVAELFGDMGWKSMTESLQRDPRFKDRPIRVHNYALAGYKEPQQAAMLSYLFALGQKPDAVVNLDGFNEAALGWHNARLGTNPLYPHIPHWAETGSNTSSNGEMLDYLYDVRSKQLKARSFGEWFLGSGLWRSCFLYHAGSVRFERLRRSYVGAYGKLMDRILNGPKDVGVRGPEFPEGDTALGRMVLVSWMETSTSIQGMCAQRGIPYLHVLQPTLHDTGSKPLTAKEVQNATIDPDWIAGVHAMYPQYRKAKKLLESRGIHFFDASQIFRDHPEDVYYDLCHFAEHGNEILGSAIGEELAKIDPR